MFSSKKKTGFSKFVASIPNGVWIVISLAAALLLWVVISHTEKGGVVFATDVYKRQGRYFLQILFTYSVRELYLEHFGES